jgi:hypothetical protein
VVFLDKLFIFRQFKNIFLPAIFFVMLNYASSSSLSEQRALLRQKIAKLENLHLLKRQREQQFRNLMLSIHELEKEVRAMRQDLREQERATFADALLRD